MAAGGGRVAVGRSQPARRPAARVSWPARRAAIAWPGEEWRCSLIAKWRRPRGFRGYGALIRFPVRQSFCPVWRCQPWIAGHFADDRVEEDWQNPRERSYKMSGNTRGRQRQPGQHDCRTGKRISTPYRWNPRGRRHLADQKSNASPLARPCNRRRGAQATKPARQADEAGCDRPTATLPPPADIPPGSTGLADRRRDCVGGPALQS